MRPPLALALRLARYYRTRYEAIHKGVLDALGYRADTNDIRVHQAIHTFDRAPIDAAFLDEIAHGVNAANTRALRVAGVPSSRIVPVGEIAKFREQNIALIKRLDDEAKARLAEILAAQDIAGSRVETLTSDIQDAFDTTGSHSELIARDQTLKLNGQISQYRQTSAGIVEYTWSTSGDERVRPDHADLDGTVQRWDDPPIVDEKSNRAEHPGGDFQCRCVAIPILPWDA